MKKLRTVTAPGKREQITFADRAGVSRNSESGLDLMPIGALGSRVRVGEGVPLLVFNSGGSVAYVKFGDNTVAAPTGPLNGVPIAAGEKFMLNSGDQAYVIASSVNVYGYAGDSDEDLPGSDA